MVRPDTDVLVFLDDFPGDVQLARLGIEVDGGHEDGELDVHAGGGGAAGGGLGCDATDCGGAEDVGGRDEVVCMPLVHRSAEALMYVLRTNALLIDRRECAAGISDGCSYATTRRALDQTHHVLRLLRQQHDGASAVALDVLFHETHVDRFLCRVYDLRSVARRLSLVVKLKVTDRGVWRGSVFSGAQPCVAVT